MGGFITGFTAVQQTLEDPLYAGRAGKDAAGGDQALQPPGEPHLHHKDWGSCASHRTAQDLKNSRPQSEEFLQGHAGCRCIPLTSAPTFCRDTGMVFILSTHFVHCTSTSKVHQCHAELSADLSRLWCTLPGSQHEICEC